MIFRSPHWGNGLSPRERGNRDSLSPSSSSCGSIPARAGESLASARLTSVTRVYPRASGGTETMTGIPSTRNGLSPRERGNPIATHIGQSSPRSIPARAGEPAVRIRPNGTSTVYPRASGGTPVLPDITLPVGGLSPRERGNHRILDRDELRGGSIPARAGEPYSASNIARRAAVYPRASGGTSESHSSTTDRSGLSPRERGNPFKRTATLIPMRSIPARAGEPPPLRGRCAQRSVYPRASGGTP